MRLKVLSLVFLAGFLALIFRLFFWQVVKSKELGHQAKSQYTANEFLVAPRGSIMAKDASWLAARGEAYLVFAEVPKLKEEPRKIADSLAPFFVDEEADRSTLLAEVERLISLMSRKSVVWVPLKNKVTAEVKDKIAALEIDGIGFERKEDRFYPEGSQAAHLLGFVGKNEEGNDQGYFGLEGYYNLSLAGKPGFNSSQKDPKGNPILIGDRREIAAIGGVDLLTHIDKTVERILEDKLREGIEKFQASAGTGIIMNPKDGSIFAMSSFPSYDPREYWQFGDDYFKDPVISDAYEPGSIFKIIVMASGLDAGVVKPDTVCDICDGPLKVDKYFIETWNKKYNPDSTMTDVIIHSDNVGMAYVSQKLGADALYDYLDKFGFGKPTGVDLQGEASPKLRQKGTWNIVDLATAGFGQGVAVTPIQMIRAAAVIANGGKLVTPHVVDKLLGVGWEKEIKPQAGERVIGKKAAAEITDMMVEAAKSGEAKWTNISGFKIAGKTGTAQIPISGHYDSEKTIASFVGFAPADDAKFVMLISLREPKSSPWASETAAPLWYSIARDLFPYFGVQPE
ncbi:hypothetical protein A2361_01835 [Candidatus Woesebacteria bacterium RIFOXYB1_FULL_40_26]|uniref:Penicillin-binding protein transpeptidase domain-containing protein n=2 Tax=Candidatus Woeseibacteriota TaxID=1752722 RepID=A0A1F8D0V5_9BACT|nr:MAG: Peptidoglycan glycosyltransferase [Candidatus Woesebacteria bacterium GW2011_GWB1_40_101]OGM81425.1 MAG: hypothetical protein A2361_01835 [Candidatus Woesebacteria bacterium RIFOXYB1_FULL_40_26]